MLVSVVVPTYNREKVVKRTVQTLLSQDFPRSDYEIIVVVDGSVDRTARALRRLPSRRRLRVIEQPNRGLAAARNIGLAAAEGRVVIFLDDDMLCDTGLVLEHFRAHSSGDATLGFGAIFLSSDSPPSLTLDCFNRELGAYYLQQLKGISGSLLPPIVFGNTSAVRQLLVASGGFDERFRMREDEELGTRLLAAGVGSQYLPRAIAHQYYTKSPEDLLSDAEAFALADVLFVQTHPSKLSHTFIGHILSDPFWKRVLRRVAASNPRLACSILAPACRLGERLYGIKALRNVGVRALQIQRGIYYYHQVLEALGSGSSL